MSLLDLVAVVVFVASLIGIAVVVFRKFPLVASIDVQATSNPHSNRKGSLLEQRLKRKFQGAWSRVANISQPALRGASSSFQRARQKLVDLEHEYKVRSLPVLLNRRQRQRVQTEVEALVQQAQLFLNDGEHRAAEDKAFQAIRLDPRSVPAFELLGSLYLETREHAHAREVYQYLLKIRGESDTDHEHLAEADRGEGRLEEAEHELQRAITLNGNVMAYHLQLAQIERQLQRWPEAFESIQAASRLEPNHPKVLDELIEISLGYGKRQFAEDALKTIREKNPDNSKIPEWEKRLNEL
jgi:tetratricopeptide (TPR) repeat protein